MSTDAFELAALTARYVFAGLMLLIVLRAARLTAVDSRRAAKLRRLSPMTGLSGELVVLEGDGNARRGMRYPVIREGMIGSSRRADIRIRHGSVRRRHAYFQLTAQGLRVRDHAGARLYDRHGEPARELLLGDGGEFVLGRIRLLLVLSDAVAAPEDEDNDLFEAGGMDPEDFCIDLDPFDAGLSSAPPQSAHPMDEWDMDGAQGWTEYEEVETAPMAEDEGEIDLSWDASISRTGPRSTAAARRRAPRPIAEPRQTAPIRREVEDGIAMRAPQPRKSTGSRIEAKRSALNASRIRPQWSLDELDEGALSPDGFPKRAADSQADRPRRTPSEASRPRNPRRAAEVRARSEDLFFSDGEDW